MISNLSEELLTANPIYLPLYKERIRLFNMINHPLELVTYNQINDYNKPFYYASGTFIKQYNIIKYTSKLGNKETLNIDYIYKNDFYYKLYNDLLYANNNQIKIIIFELIFKSVGFCSVQKFTENDLDTLTTEISNKRNTY